MAVSTATGICTKTKISTMGDKMSALIPKKNTVLIL